MVRCTIMYICVIYTTPFRILCPYDTWCFLLSKTAKAIYKNQSKQRDCWVLGKLCGQADDACSTYVLTLFIDCTPTTRLVHKLTSSPPCSMKLTKYFFYFFNSNFIQRGDILFVSLEIGYKHLQWAYWTVLLHIVVITCLLICQWLAAK
jgi:hypothetical protein